MDLIECYYCDGNGGKQFTVHLESNRPPFTFFSQCWYCAGLGYVKDDHESKWFKV